MTDLGCCTVVSQDEVAVVERCGKFDIIANPGCHFVFCCIGQVVAGRLSTRVQQLDVKCETKTKDSVFVTVTMSIQYEVESSDNAEIQKAFYRLSNVDRQLESYVFDSVRSTLPKIALDDIFEAKDEIADVVKGDLLKSMPEYGYKILKVLTVDIDIEAKVKSAMNDINMNTRLRIAASEKAEADKILVVKAAEADAESRYLIGVGLSRQRQAIISGLRDSVISFSGDVGGVSPQDVMHLLLTTQYVDMLTTVGTQAGSSVVFIPHNPGSMEDIGTQMRGAMMEAAAGNAHMGAPNVPAQMHRGGQLATA